MPIIPLIAQSRPLSPVAAPVLDHQQRPTVDNRGLMQENQRLANAQKQPELPQALAAPYEALGAVGSAIMKAGSVLGAVADKQLEMETRAQVSRAQAAMAGASKDYDAAKAQNPDPIGFTDLWEKTAGSGLKDRLLSDESLHPAAREKISMDYDAFYGLGAKDALLERRLGVNKEVAAADRAGLVTAIQTQKKDFFDAQFDSMVQRGTIHEFERPQYERAFAEESERQTKKAQADAVESGRNIVIGATLQEGEAGAISKLESGDLGSYEPQVKEQFRSIIKGVSRGRQDEIGDDLANKIATGEIRDDAKLGEYLASDPQRARFASPALVEKVKAEIYRKDDAEQRAAEALDREQNGPRNFAEQFSKISSYDRSQYKTDADAQVAAFQLRLETKRRVGAQDDGFLQKLLWEKANGQIKQGDATKDLVNDRLKTAFDPKTGISPWMVPQVKDVSERKWDLIPKDAIDYVPGVGAAKMLLGETVSKKVPVLDERGKPKLVIDPEKQREAQVAMAKVKQTVENWVKANPKDANDPVKVDQAIQRALPEGVKVKALENQQRKLQPAATPVAGRITSYAYPGDETPDSNSHAGIGAFTTEADAKGAPDAPTRLRLGDLSVSPDVEAKLRAAGVQPRASIMVKLANGEVRQARWMDRTRDDLRGRFDFYSPGGKDHRDGMNVVEWWKG